ncbi:MAG TPA: hypothetical protein PLQ76_09290, partial [bacterium]|nr:hypothetical protein [bacterium]
MPVAIWFAIFAVMTLSAAPARAEGYKDVAAALKSRIEKFDVALDTWNYRAACDEKCIGVNPPEGLKWKKAGPGLYWPEANQVFWFRREYTVPEKVAGRSIAGSKIFLKMNVSDGGD